MALSEHQQRLVDEYILRNLKIAKPRVEKSPRPEKPHRVSIVHDDRVHTMTGTPLSGNRRTRTYKRWIVRQLLRKYMPLPFQVRLKAAVPPLCILRDSAAAPTVSRMPTLETAVLVGAKWLIKHFPAIYTHAAGALLLGDVKSGKDKVWIERF